MTEPPNKLLTLAFNFHDDNPEDDPVMESTVVVAPNREGRATNYDNEGHSFHYRSKAKQPASYSPESGNSEDPEAEYVPADDEFSNGDHEDEGGEDGVQQGRMRASGVPMAKQRRIQADLDETDQKIYDMKTAGYTNEKVAEALIKDGLTVYDPKTIGSRYIRMKSKIEARREKDLEDGLIEWQEGEDEALLRAEYLAREEIKEIIAHTKARRWQLVARNLNKIINKDNVNEKFTPKSCQQRFVAIHNDTATIPIGLDDNPDQRRADKARREAAVMRERAVKEAQEKQMKEEKQAKADKQKRRKAVAEHEAAVAQLRKAEENVARLKNKIETTAAGGEASSPNVTKKKKQGIEPEVAALPRNHLSVKELEALLGSRGEKKTGSKAELIKRLAANDESMTVTALIKKLSDLGERTDGSKSELIERLVGVEVSNSAWGQKHGGGMKRASVGEASTSHTRRQSMLSSAVATEEEDQDEDSMMVDPSLTENDGPRAPVARMF